MILQFHHWHWHIPAGYRGYVETFKGTPYDTGLNQDILAEINEYFAKIREEAMASGLLNPKVLGVNINTLRYQVPGRNAFQHDFSAERAERRG